MRGPLGRLDLVHLLQRRVRVGLRHAVEDLRHAGVQLPALLQRHKRVLEGRRGGIVRNRLDLLDLRGHSGLQRWLIVRVLDAVERRRVIGQRARRIERVRRPKRRRLPRCRLRRRIHPASTRHRRTRQRHHRHPQSSPHAYLSSRTLNSTLTAKNKAAAKMEQSSMIQPQRPSAKGALYTSLRRTGPPAACSLGQAASGQIQSKSSEG